MNEDNDKKHSESRENISVTLGRIDERTNALDKNLSRLDSKFEEYITRHEFTPVKILTYGFAGIVLVAVITALITSVVTSGA